MTDYRISDVVVMFLGRCLHGLHAVSQAAGASQYTSKFLMTESAIQNNRESIKLKIGTPESPPKSAKRVSSPAKYIFQPRSLLQPPTGPT